MLKQEIPTTDPQLTGNVFDIQRYSIHDGRGIRTVVFLKGCPLRCRWCANPESWAAHPELFYIKSRCIGCGSCAAACKGGEAQMTQDGLVLHRERVTQDLTWTKACPTGALCVKGKQMTAAEVFAEIEKDRIFYEYSGGGVTFSGGEPFLQDTFVTLLLRICKEKGISTAVETTGCVSWEILERVAPLVDLFLYDIKSASSQVHHTWTGKGNERILENLRLLAKAGADIMVRTPLIPGVNDRREDVRAIMDILKDCGVRKYAILPFHQYGSGKYESIGRPYELAGLQSPAETYVEELKGMIREAGFSDVF